MLYATQGLVETLLRLASERAPDEATISLAVTPAGEIPETDLDPETPVFTHFYLPSAGSSVNAVFGVDLGTPVGRGGARFLSHPEGFLGVSKTDDLAGVVLVAVPPYDNDAVAAFDRAGDGIELGVLDAAPPEESLPE